MNERLKSDLSPRTVQLSLVILRHALQTAVKWGLVGRNVAKLVDTPKVRRPEIKPLISNSRVNSLARPKVKGSKHFTAWRSGSDFEKAKHSDCAG